MIRRHILISGRVQGVCFRAEAKIRASRLGISGFIKNLEDGRVEATIEGEEKKVEKFVKWTKRGPMFAKVTNVEIMEENYKNEFSKFNIVY